MDKAEVIEKAEVMANAVVMGKKGVIEEACVVENVGALTYAVVIYLQNASEVLSPLKRGVQ